MRQNNPLESIGDNDVVLPPILDLSSSNKGSKESIKRRGMPEKREIVIVESDAKRAVDIKVSKTILRA